MNRRGFFGRLSALIAGGVAAKVVKPPEAKCIGALPEPEPEMIEFGWQSFPSTLSTSPLIFCSTQVVTATDNFGRSQWVYLGNKPKRRTRHY